MPSKREEAHREQQDRSGVAELLSAHCHGGLCGEYGAVGVAVWSGISLVHRAGVIRETLKEKVRTRIMMTRQQPGSACPFYIHLAVHALSQPIILY